MSIVEKHGMRQNKFVLAVTGSIGTGKSYASKFFEKKGCTILDADVIAKSLYVKGSTVLSELSDLFGKSVLNDDGSLNKENLSQIVFNDEVKLKQLNNLLKLHLKAEIDRLIDKVSIEDAKPFIVLEAPVLFEYGFEEYADYILLITANEAKIIERVIKRSGLKAEEIKARFESQIPQEEKKQLSNYWIDNSGTMEEFDRRLEEFYEKRHTFIHTHTVL